MKNTVKILADWGDLIAVQKPPGWLTIPGRGNKVDVPVLSHILGSQLRGPQRQRSSPDLFVIHRLDEGTSGVILFARTAAAHKEISALFESREMKKTYWAIVKGIPPSQTIDAPIFKLPSKRVKSVVDAKGKAASTAITVKASNDGLSIIEAVPLTGRSHQIRVHLSYIGAPIVGDKLYGGQSNVCGMQFDWPLLHARELKFQWPQGTLREVSAPLTGPFLQMCEALGFSSSCAI